MSSAGQFNPQKAAHEAARAGFAEHHSLTLTPADAAAVDHCLEGEGGGAHDAVEAARLARAQAWLNTLGVAHAEQPAWDLAARTLRAVETQRARVAEPAKARTFAFGRRTVEWLTMGVAAALLLTVLVPGMVAVRRDARRVMCAGNMADMGRAFALYAADNHNQLPSLGVSPDGNWLPHEGALVSTAGHSNTANLLPLIRENYVAQDKLLCPARSQAAATFDPSANEIPDRIRGYSYINLFGPAPLWDHDPATVVLADRNPLFARGAAETASSDTTGASLNHTRRGMNVLTAEQAVYWVRSPVVGPNGDNIWTIADRSPVYTGRETVRVARDLFLAP